MSSAWLASLAKRASVVVIRRRRPGRYGGGDRQQEEGHRGVPRQLDPAAKALGGRAARPTSAASATPRNGRGRHRRGGTRSGGEEQGAPRLLDRTEAGGRWPHRRRCRRHSRPCGRRPGRRGPRCPPSRSSGGSHRRRQRCRGRRAPSGWRGRGRGEGEEAHPFAPAGDDAGAGDDAEHGEGEQVGDALVDQNPRGRPSRARHRPGDEEQAAPTTGRPRRQSPSCQSTRAPLPTASAPKSTVSSTGSGSGRAILISFE